MEAGRDYKYSVLTLIELVRVRPVLWDSTRVEYRSYKNKDKAWQEVFQEIDECYLSMDEKERSIVAMKITTKWRNIRDVFIRSLKKGATDKKMRKYIYHDRLSFMLKLYTTNPETETPEQNGYRQPSRAKPTPEGMTERSLSFDNIPEESMEEKSMISIDEYLPYVKNEPEDREEEELTNDGFEGHRSLNNKIKACDEEIENTNSSDDQFSYAKYETSKQKKRKRYSTVAGTQQNIVGNPGTCTLMQHDDDEAFMVSILPLLKDMTIDEKLNFRTSTLQKISEIRSKRPST